MATTGVPPDLDHRQDLKYYAAKSWCVKSHQEGFEFADLTVVEQSLSVRCFLRQAEAHGVF